MKNKEMIIFLVIALMISAPVVYADNFLTGYSIFDKVGNFFGNVFDNLKNIFVKEEISRDVRIRGDGEIPRRDEDNIFEDDEIIHTITGRISGQLTNENNPNTGRDSAIAFCNEKGFNEMINFESIECPEQYMDTFYYRGGGWYYLPCELRRYGVLNHVECRGGEDEGIFEGDEIIHTITGRISGQLTEGDNLYIGINSAALFCLIKGFGFRENIIESEECGEYQGYAYYSRYSDWRITKECDPRYGLLSYVECGNNRGENQPPTITLDLPENNAQNQETSLTLSWTGNDPDGDQLYYDVYLNNNPIGTCQDITQTTCNIADLVYKTQYSWYVIVTDNINAPVQSNPRVFTTKERVNDEICGNGIKEGTERCDGNDWGNVRNCIDLGYDSGRLRCVEPDEIRQRERIPCRFDTSQCYYEENQPPEIPVPTLGYETIEDNRIRLIWENVLQEEPNIPTTRAITSYAVYEEGFFNNIITFIKKLFGKTTTIGLETSNKRYIIYKNNEEDKRLDSSRCNEVCTLELEALEGEKYKIKSKIGDYESEFSNEVTIHFEIPEERTPRRIRETPEEGFILNIIITPRGYGTVTKVEDKERYDLNEQVNIIAIPSGNNEFLEWREDALIRGLNPLTVLMNENKEITAVFQSIPETICNDGIDNDNDGLIDCQDILDCPNRQNGPSNEDYPKGYFCMQNQLHELNFTNSIDDDKDLIIDSLDKDCSTYNSRNNINQIQSCTSLAITSLRTSSKEFYSHSRIPVTECFYTTTPELNSQNIMQCINTTLNNAPITCQQKTMQQQQGKLIRYQNCDVGPEGLNKAINCSISNNCIGTTSNTVYINVTEFTTCEDIQTPQHIEITRIQEPRNNEEFEAGENIEIIAKVKNTFLNEDEEDIEISVVASLVDTEEWDEIEISEPIKKEIGYLEDETFELNLTIPEDLEEGDYRLYVKAYRNRYEDELCKSSSINIKIKEPEDSGRVSCEEDIDCSRGFTCTNNECVRLTCNAPLILSEDGHNCIIREPPGARGDDRGTEGGGEEREQQDSDGDGLPDWWEFNHFGNLDQGPYDDPDNDGISNIDEFTHNTDPTIPNKSSSIIWTILIIILIIGIVATGIFFVIKKIKNKPKRTYNSNYSLDQTNQNKLQQYIQQAKAQGMNKQQIKNSLLNAGWKEKDINKFL